MELKLMIRLRIYHHKVNQKYNLTYAHRNTNKSKYLCNLIYLDEITILGLLSKFIFK